MYTAALSLTALDIARGDRLLLQGLTLDLSPGEGLLLVGPNGAGKTTLLRTLAGLIPAAGGEFRYSTDDQPLSLDQAVAYLSHADGLKPGETVKDTLAFWQDLYQSKSAPARTILKQLGMERMMRRPCSRLSAGQKRRVALARVIMSQRPVWILDEPAAPLDTAGRGLLADLCQSHRDQGGIVIAATHVDLGWQTSRTLDLAALNTGGGS